MQTSIAFSLLGRGVEPGLGELDTCSRTLVLQSEMLDHRYEVYLLGGGEGGGGGVAGHEVVEGGHCDGAFGFVEEDDGDEEAEGIVAEFFLHEAEACGGERRERYAGDPFGRRFGEVG